MWLCGPKTGAGYSAARLVSERVLGKVEPWSLVPIGFGVVAAILSVAYARHAAKVGNADGAGRE